MTAELFRDHLNGYVRRGFTAYHDIVEDSLTNYIRVKARESSIAMHCLPPECIPEGDERAEQEFGRNYHVDFGDPENRKPIPSRLVRTNFQINGEDMIFSKELHHYSHAVPFKTSGDVDMRSLMLDRKFVNELVNDFYDRAFILILNEFLHRDEHDYRFRRHDVQAPVSDIILRESLSDCDLENGFVLTGRPAIDIPFRFETSDGMRFGLTDKCYLVPDNRFYYIPADLGKIELLDDIRVFVTTDGPILKWFCTTRVRFVFDEDAQYKLRLVRFLGADGSLDKTCVGDPDDPEECPRELVGQGVMTC